MLDHPAPGVATCVAAVRDALSSWGPVSDLLLDGRPVVIATRSDFRWRWFATRLVTTVTVTAPPPDADVAALDRLLVDARREALAAVGRTAGLQSGAAAVVVAVLPAMTQAAHDWAVRAHGHGVAAVAYPVAVGAHERQLVQPAHLRVGRLFQGFLRDLVHEVVAVPLGGLSRPEAPTGPHQR